MNPGWLFNILRCTGTLEPALELSSDGSISEVEETFECTTCGYNIHVCKIEKHPQLGVGICKKCKIFLYSGPFTKVFFIHSIHLSILNMANFLYQGVSWFIFF